MREALGEGPQFVGLGAARVVILSSETYERLTRAKSDFKSFLTEPGPDFGEIDLTRDRSRMWDSEP